MLSPCRLALVFSILALLVLGSQPVPDENSPNEVFYENSINEMFLTTLVNDSNWGNILGNGDLVLLIAYSDIQSSDARPFKTILNSIMTRYQGEYASTSKWPPLVFATLDAATNPRLLVSLEIDSRFPVTAFLIRPEGLTGAILYSDDFGDEGKFFEWILKTIEDMYSGVPLYIEEEANEELEREGEGFVSEGDEEVVNQRVVGYPDWLY